MAGENYLTLVPVSSMSFFFFNGNFRCTSYGQLRVTILFPILYHQPTIHLIFFLQKILYLVCYKIAFLELKDESYENIGMGI